MENSGYVTLTRQSGLMRELQVIANNIANQATTGFRQEGVIFSEHVKRIEGSDSLSMAMGNVRNTSMLQGTLDQTGAPFDLAIEGDGFFLIETPAGQRLTRAGAFTPDANGELVTPEGYRVLDAGGAPIFVPPNSDIAIGRDGTMSQDGNPIAQIGLWQPVDPLTMIREDGVRFRTEAGVEPTPDARVLQGFLEQSNVDPLMQVARMIEVQRAYELGQSFLENEHERIRNLVQNITR